jgi:hypothetical protein
MIKNGQNVFDFARKVDDAGLKLRFSKVIPRTLRPKGGDNRLPAAGKQKEIYCNEGYRVPIHQLLLGGYYYYGNRFLYVDTAP